ncbi:MAG TPA: hypothetical protein DCE41_00840 [Cytophagales bacterium]|nr:hypothetical protein [Cytophagales bacterium]HAA20091.1 hypothetical protein [Cytophagales bacterium]HAP60638.1 hypothetical protein [Cytophagales bacterium]
MDLQMAMEAGGGRVPPEGGILTYYGSNGTSRKNALKVEVLPDEPQESYGQTGQLAGLPVRPQQPAATPSIYPAPSPDPMRQFYEAQYHVLNTEINNLRQTERQDKDTINRLTRELELEKTNAAHALEKKEYETAAAKRGGLAGPETKEFISTLFPNGIGEALGMLAGLSASGGKMPDIPEWLHTELGQNLGLIANWLETHKRDSVHQPFWGMMEFLLVHPEPETALSTLVDTLQNLQANGPIQEEHGDPNSGAQAA